MIVGRQVMSPPCVPCGLHLRGSFMLGACSSGSSFSAAEVVALVVAWVRQALQRDWHRVGLSRGDLQDLPSWCAGDQRFELPVEQFELRWCRGGVLAEVGMH